MISPNDIRFEILKEEGNACRFALGPLNHGYGYTLGNSLRRVLLSSLAGAAVTEVRFSGVPHQFTTIAGVKEDVVQLTLNLKKIRFNLAGDGPVDLRLSATGEGEVTAGDIEASAGVEVVNPDLVIAHLTDKKAKLEADLLVESGYGYVPAEERETQKVGVIVLDAIFTPVLNVAYQVEAVRVGQITNLDRLLLDITTDGTIAPKDALLKAAEILMQHFYRVAQGEVEEDDAPVEERPRMTAEEKKLPLEDLELPTRVNNSLKKGGVTTCGELVDIILKGGVSGLTGIQNVGEKSLEEIQKKVTARGWFDEET